MQGSFLTRRLKALILISFGLTVARAITLPVIAVYLSQTLSMTQTSVGYILGISLSVSVLASLFGGYIVDRVSRRMLLCWGLGTLSITSGVFPHLTGWLTVQVTLMLTYSTVSLLEITIKAYIAQFVEPVQRIKAFSLTYTANAMAYAVGPLAGALLALYDLSHLFYAAAAVSLATLCIVPAIWSSLSTPKQKVDSEAPRSFINTLNVLHHDKKLIMFICSGILAAVIHARWSAYLAQYLAVVSDAKTAYQYVAYIIATNAIAVVLLQYSIGSRISTNNLHKCIYLGLTLFAVGLAFFAWSTALWVWIFAMLVFSVGEVLFTPASYIFVDQMAPENMKGSYYGALNLTNLGGAISPAICGLLLSSTASEAIFPFLILVTMASGVLFAMANRR